MVNLPRYRGRKMSKKHWSEETSWRKLSDVAEELKSRIEQNFHKDDDTASEAHDDLVCVEHRMRIAEGRSK